MDLLCFFTYNLLWWAFPLIGWCLCAALHFALALFVNTVISGYHCSPRITPRHAIADININPTCPIFLAFEMLLISAAFI